MTVKEMLRRISARELVEWLALMRIEAREREKART